MMDQTELPWWLDYTTHSRNESEKIMLSTQVDSLNDQIYRLNVEVAILKELVISLAPRTSPTSLIITEPESTSSRSIKV